MATFEVSFLDYEPQAITAQKRSQVKWFYLKSLGLEKDRSLFSSPGWSIHKQAARKCLRCDKSFMTASHEFCEACKDEAEAQGVMEAENMLFNGRKPNLPPELIPYWKQGVQAVQQKRSRGKRRGKK